MNVLPFRTSAECAHAQPLVVAHLRAGGILGYPTETVYGLGCLLDGAALDALAQLKGRRAEKSFLLLVGARDHIRGVSWTASARRLADAFWPGPLTLALRANAGFPAHVINSNGAVAIRLTGHEYVRNLLLELGEPITSTSANLAGEPPAADAAGVAAVLTGRPDLNTLILDAGPLPPAAPSTLVDCSEEVPRLVRAGAIPLEALKRCVDEVRA